MDDIFKNYSDGGNLTQNNSTPSSYNSDVMRNYEKVNEPINNTKNEKLLLPFMVPFFFLSEKAAIYYHIYKEFTGALEKIFKERVFTSNNPITGVTEAKIDKFTFAPTKRYQRGALIVFIITQILTLVSILTPFYISLISTFLLIYILLSSFYVDLYFPAKTYTYASKKFADERLEITQDFYDNYILNFRLTEKVYFSAIFTSWFILILSFILQDVIEYNLIFKSSIGELSWYIFIASLLVPTSLLVLYHFEKEKIKNSADMKRETLIEDIRNVTKTNFDIARNKLKDYK